MTMVEHLYTVTVDAIQEPVEFTYDAHELELPDDASAELAVSYVQAKILTDPAEFISIPWKLYITIERSDGDTCHASMAVDWPTEDDDDD